MDNQYYTQGLMIGLGITFIVLPAIAVALRTWAKLLSRKGLGSDDYLIFCALVRRLKLQASAMWR